MRLLPAAAALLGLLALPACAGPSALPLTVSLDQSRDLENRHLLAARVTNDGGEPVDVVRLQVRSGAWSTVAPTVREETLAPGRRLAFPVPYGAADCRSAGAASLVVGYRRDGALQEAVVPVPAEDPLLPRLHRRECDLAALGRAADVGFAPGWTRVGDTARGELRLSRRRGDTPVTVTAVDGSVILTLEALGPLPLTLEGATVRLPVAATPTRCDPHALAESKRTYVFAIAVASGAGEPLTVAARPDPADLPLLEQLVRDVCLPPP